jgi:hypothetical protein
VIEFECSICGSKQAHRIRRFFAELKQYKESENIFELKNFMYDSMLIVRACADCHTMRADWEKISESNATTEADKARVKELLGNETFTEEDIVEDRGEYS